MKEFFNTGFVNSQNLGLPFSLYYKKLFTFSNNSSVSFLLFYFYNLIGKLFFDHLFRWLVYERLF